MRRLIGARRAGPASHVIAIMAALALTACTPKVAPPGDALTSPQLTPANFITADGLALPVRQWVPEGDAREIKAVVLALHGFNDYSKAFDKVPGAPGAGPFLAQHGVAVFAYDQRSFGRAPNPGIWPGRNLLVTDFTAFARLLKARYPQTPLYALGESMGGAVVMTALAGPDPPPVNGAILAAPAVWARSTMPLSYRIALWFGAHFLPSAKPTGQSLGRRASDNIEMLRDNARDPLFIKKTRLDAVYGLTNLMDEALAASPHIKVPVLYLYGKNDEIIPKDATQKALGALMAPALQTRAAFYSNGWHMILRDRDAATVLGDVAAFLKSPKTPLPSGADRAARERLEASAKSE